MVNDDPSDDSPKRGAQGPLAGVRVIDLSNFLAAPSVSMYLGDMGAEVIKVERPDGGDEFRNWGRNIDGVGLYYKVINRNKRSITADLGDELGVRIVKKLVETTDILIENYRPGRMERWGLDYATLAAINPGLIMLRITGYGQNGPYAHKPGFGTALEGFGGAVYISGYPEKPPLLPSFGLADSSSGIMGAFLAAAALHERGRNGGLGQVVEFGLYETMLGMLGPIVIDYDQLGIVQERAGSRVPWVAPRNTYRTKDDLWVALSASSDQTFARLCQALGAPQLIADARFRTNRERIQNASALDDALQEAIARFSRSEVIELLESGNAVVAPVNSVAEIFADPHIIARENITPVFDDELARPLRMQNVVGRFSRTPGEIRSTGPALGEHNRDILVGELGFMADELRAAGIPLD